MSISPAIGFGAAGAIGLAAGYGLSKVFDTSSDAARDRAIATRDNARRQLENPDLTPEAREGLETLADKGLPGSSSEKVAGAGAITGGGIAAVAAAMTLPMAMVALMSLGNANGFPMLKSMAIGGGLLGAGMVAGAGIHALTD